MSMLPIAEWMETRRGEVTVATLAGTTSLRITSGALAAGELRVKSPTLVLDPGGAGRTLNLPPAARSLAGLRLVIVNSADAAEALTVTDITDSPVTVCTVTQNEAGRVLCADDGAGAYKWYNLGVGKNT